MARHTEAPWVAQGLTIVSTRTPSIWVAEVLKYDAVDLTAPGRRCPNSRRPGPAQGAMEQLIEDCEEQPLSAWVVHPSHLDSARAAIAKARGDKQ